MDTNNHVVRFIAPNATIWRVAGTGLSGSGGNGGPATLATLNLPVSARSHTAVSPALASSLRHPHCSLTLQVAGVLDGAGGLFVLEKGNCVVRRIFANGSIALVVGTGVCATTAIGDGGPASLARLQSPTGLLDDGAGGLLIAGAPALCRFAGMAIAFTGLLCAAPSQTRATAKSGATIP